MVSTKASADPVGALVLDGSELGEKSKPLYSCINHSLMVAWKKGHEVGQDGSLPLRQFHRGLIADIGPGYISQQLSSILVISPLVLKTVWAA